LTLVLFNVATLILPSVYVALCRL